MYRAYGASQLELCLPEEAAPEVAADQKRIYAAATADEAEQRLSEFEAKRDEEYLPIG